MEVSSEFALLRGLEPHNKQAMFFWRFYAGFHGQMGRKARPSLTGHGHFVFFGDAQHLNESSTADIPWYQMLKKHGADIAS